MAIVTPEPVISAGRPLQVGAWRVDPARNEIRRGDHAVRLEPKAIEVLAYLAKKPGEVVGREELLSALWPGVVVGDDALTQAVIKLRKALGDDAHSPAYIETISKRGYRLIAPVQDPVAEAGVRAASTPIASRTGRRRRGVALVAAMACLVALTAFGVFRLSGTSRLPWPIGAGAPHGVSNAMPVVAILPLRNLGEDPKRRYFSDGITEDVIAALGRFSGVRVMSMNAVEAFRDTVPSLRAVRQQLDARYIVKGTVRESGRTLRVSVEMSDAQTGELLWSERYEGQGADLFVIQDRIVNSIVGALHVRLNQLEQARVFHKPTESLEAYDLVLRARALLGQFDRRANREARGLLTRAAELAPDYAEVWIIQGEAEIQRGLYGWVEDALEPLKTAENLARRALASPDARAHSRAHYLLSRVLSNVGKPVEALAHAELSVEGNPSDASALYWRGVSLLYVGRLEDAIATMESARRLDPNLNQGDGFNLALGYFIGGRPRDALGLTDVLLTRFPNDIALHIIRTAALSQMQEMEAARQSAAEVRRLNPYFDVKFVGSRFVKAEDRSRIQDALRRAGL